MSATRTTAIHLAAILLLVTAIAPAHASVKGRSYAVYANLSSYGVAAATHCDTGWLNSVSGGSRSSYKSNVSYGNTLRVDYMESESHGDRCKGHSGSRLEAGWILKGSPFEVTWTHMESADEDTCCKPQDKDEISSVFEGLMFAGKPVIVTGQPNQTIFVAGATLVLNESKKEPDTDCDDDDEEHRALHLILRNGNEVILGGSKFDSDDDCCAVTSSAHSTWGALKAHYR